MSTIAHVSLEEYQHMVEAGAFEGRRLEYIRGEIREMSPKGDRHEDMVDCLDDWSHEVLRGKPVRVRIQNSIRLPGPLALPEPDVAWVVRRRYSGGKPEAGDVYRWRVAAGVACGKVPMRTVVSGNDRCAARTTVWNGMSDLPTGRLSYDGDGEPDC